MFTNSNTHISSGGDSMNDFALKYGNVLLGSSVGTVIGMFFGPVGSILGAAIGYGVGSMFHRFFD